VPTVPAARPWCPADPSLYLLDVTHGADEYSLPVGIRAVRVDGARLLLNGEPVRLRGFGMHEDTALCGKGHDDARMIRGFALLKWIGANSFRTARTIEPEASSIMSSFAHGLIADRSAGLIAVAVQKASER
jgi:beta-glucuronidase